MMFKGLGSAWCGSKIEYCLIQESYNVNCFIDAWRDLAARSTSKTREQPECRMLVAFDIPRALLVNLFDLILFM